MSRRNSISVVMPYWRRPQALSETLQGYSKLYKDIEIIVVDDGSWDLPEGLEGIEIIALPEKKVALNPCVPFNVGVRIAKGEYVVLTNPEVRHTKPILEEMKAECERLGPKAYVSAACWSPEKKWWYCHSHLSPKPESVGRGPLPKDAGFHFCSMLRRDFYYEIGGFSEEYRDGQGYDDNDLLWKLEAGR